MKQFKNKFTGDVATLINETGYKLNSEVIGLIPAKYIESSNDWEEVKEEVKKDYEILSVRSKDDKHILSLVRAMTLAYKNLDEHASNPRDWEIYSVKRVSDGVIFTIGDRVAATDNRYYDGNKISKGNSGNWIQGFYDTKIVNFVKTEQTIVALYEYSMNGFGQPIEYVEKLTPLFKSCDGVEIFAGQSWWYVAHNKMVAKETSTLTYRGTNESEVSRFSTREKAEMWIRNNRKPNFVTDDGVKIFPGDKYWSVNLKTLSMWEATCNNGTQKNGDNKVFSNECNAKKYYMFDAPVLSLNDVASIYVSANKEVTDTISFSEQNRRIQNLVLSKLTNHGKQK